MAKLHIPADYGLFSFKSTNNATHHCVSEIGVNTSATVGQTDVDTVSTAVAGAFKGLYISGCRYDGLSLLLALPSGLLQRFDSIAGAGQGTRSGSSTTPQVQFLLHKSTGFAGRAFRGRMYLPSVGESDVDDVGTITVAANTLITAVGTAITAALAVSPWSGPVLLHSDPATAPTPVIGLTGEQRVATQRRRFKR